MTGCWRCVLRGAAYLMQAKLIGLSFPPNPSCWASDAIFWASCVFFVLLLLSHTVLHLLCDCLIGLFSSNFLSTPAEQVLKSWFAVQKHYHRTFYYRCMAWKGLPAMVIMIFIYVLVLKTVLQTSCLWFWVSNDRPLSHVLCGHFVCEWKKGTMWFKGKHEGT